MHPNRASVSRAEIRERLAKNFKTQPDLIFAYGFKCQFGGGRSTGFASIYDTLELAKKVEPKYRLLRVRSLNLMAKTQKKFSKLLLLKLTRVVANNVKSERTDKRRLGEQRKEKSPQESRNNDELIVALHAKNVVIFVNE